jgi:hypothetical protein
MLENESIPVGTEDVDGRDGAGVGSESVEAEEICADENEETPVIDVHAPHGAVIPRKGDNREWVPCPRG